VLQCVAVCCSVLQCVAATHCSALQRYCNTPQHTNCWRSCSRGCDCSWSHGVAVCCSVLQCFAVCCSVVQCVAVCCWRCCGKRSDCASNHSTTYNSQHLTRLGVAVCHTSYNTLQQFIEHANLALLRILVRQYFSLEREHCLVRAL